MAALRWIDAGAETHQEQRKKASGGGIPRVTGPNSLGIPDTKNDFDRRARKQVIKTQSAFFRLQISSGRMGEPVHSQIDDVK